MRLFHFQEDTASGKPGRCGTGGPAARWLPAITFHIFPGPWTSSSYLSTFALLDFPFFFPLHAGSIFIPNSFFHFWWVEQKSFKTKMAVAERVELKIKWVLMRFLSPTLQSQSRNLWASLGNVWYQHLKALRVLCSETAIVILNWWRYISIYQFILYKSTNLINSSSEITLMYSVANASAA